MILYCIEPFPCSIYVYLSTLDFLIQSHSISFYICLFSSIFFYLGLFSSILFFLALFHSISGFLWLSLAIFGYFRLSLAISGYPCQVHLCQSLAVSGKQGQSPEIFGNLGQSLALAISGYLSLSLTVS